jgi:hypothetical protein
MVTSGQWRAGCKELYMESAGGEVLLPTVNSDRLPEPSESPGLGQFQSPSSQAAPPTPLSFFLPLEGRACPGWGHSPC